MDHKDWLLWLVENGEKLRKAGVARLELGECKVSFTPFIEPQEMTETYREPNDPLAADSTFSHLPGGKMPFWNRRPRE